MSDASDALIPSVQYTFLGSSQTARFDGVVYRPAAGPLAVGKARWQPMTRASEFLGEDGRLGEYLTRVFVEMRAIMRDPDDRIGPFATILMRTTHDTRIPFNYKPRPTHVDRPIALEYGEVDAWDLGDQLEGRGRIPMPEVDRLPGLPDDERGEHELSLDAVLATLRERIAPYLEGVAALHRAGFRRLYMLGMGPPPADRPPHFSSVRLRAKLNVLANRELQRFCAGGAATFVPVWDDVAHGGVRDPQYSLDDVHLNAASAIYPMRAIAEDLARRDRAGDG